MSNRIDLIRTVLTVVAILVMLTWGIYSSLWTYPNDQSSIVQAVVNGEFETLSNGGTAPAGNGTIVTPGSEARFIMMYRAQGPPGLFGGSYNLQNGEGFVVGPLSSILPASSFPNYAVDYAVFSFLIETQLGKPVAFWFTGPQGNLSISFYTRVEGGLDAFFPKPSGPWISGTNILKISGPGNYTLHYVNTGTVNETGKVSMGPSSVTYTHPFIVPGLTTIALAVVLAVVTPLALRRGSRVVDDAGDTNATSPPLPAKAVSMARSGIDVFGLQSG